MISLIVIITTDIQNFFPAIKSSKFNAIKNYIPVFLIMHAQTLGSTIKYFPLHNTEHQYHTMWAFKF